MQSSTVGGWQKRVDRPTPGVGFCALGALAGVVFVVFTRHPAVPKLMLKGSAEPLTAVPTEAMSHDYI